MITFIIGAAGAGKTALAAYFLKTKYLEEGKEILRKSCALIDRANVQFGRQLSKPDRVPFYTNFRVRLHVGYKRYYEPYFMNGYYFGIANDVMETQFIAPGSVMVLDEAQRIFDSRKSGTFADWASYAFEIHRQARLDIYLIAQRGMLFDRNIKELGVRVIEVVGMENEEDLGGNVEKSTWHCREFENWQAAEQSLNTGEKTYKETTYVNDGNIFESFDSYAKLGEFLPPEGKDFDYLPQEKPERLTAREKEFYKTGEPKEYRSRPKNGESDKKKDKRRNAA